MSTVLNSLSLENRNKLKDQFQKYLYREPIVTMREFVDSPKYLNLKGKVYPRVMWMLEQIDQPYIREANLSLGKGAGKSTAVVITLARMIYRTLCYNDIHSYLGLIPGSPIFVINMSVSSKQAKSVIFNLLAQIIANSPWFLGKCDIRASEIEFVHNLSMLSGSSSSTSFLGLNTIAACMDEVDYFMDNSNRVIAQEIYDELKGSMETRFPDDHKLLLISSPASEDSFLVRKINEDRKEGEMIDLTGV